MYVVVMIEPGENLTPADQINEVFGPFENDAAAFEWTARMEAVYGENRRWLIIPLSSPKVVRKLDSFSN